MYRFLRRATPTGSVGAAFPQTLRRTIMSELYNFKTEYQINPLAVGTRTPSFSWQYEQGFVGKQLSYRIEVASSEAFILSGKADMWDSGVVRSENSVGVVYGGKRLASRTRYFVRCTTESSEGERFQSGVCFFETAIWDKAEWKGKWVSVPVNFNGGTLLFRKVLTLSEGKKIVRARAYVCGLGYHEFFINGKKIGNSVLNPAVTEYGKRVFYCVYDMPGLTAGENVVGIELGYGWYGSRKLLAQFYVEYEDGSVYEDHTSPAYGWWVGGSPTLENSIYGGETYDARIEDVYPRNWNSLDFEPSWENGWMYTIYTAAPQGEPEAQEIEPIEVCGRYPEISRKDMGNGIFVIDIGQNIAGWLRIRVRGERGVSVTLKFGEGLTDSGYINQLNLRSARCTDAYILRGEGIEEFAPRFTYHGFRYVQVEIKGNAELLSCVGEHVHTATELVGSFECSDDRLNRLHKNAVITELNNEHSILTDCPQRDERFGWLNDLGSRIYQTVYNVNMARFFRKFIRDITHTQTPEGGIGDTAPYYTGGVPADPVCVIYPLMATYAYRYYGDLRICLSEYEPIKKWVEFLLSHSENYIVDYSYYADWVSPFNEVKSDNIYVSSVYLLWHLKEMKRLAEITGNKEDESLYAGHIEKSVRALNEKYFNAEECVYANGTQTENSLAVSLGVVPREYAARVVENIYLDVVKRNHHSTCGNIGYRHMFYVLAEYGHADEVVKILLNPEYPGWGYMLEKGATTVWERWEAEMQNEMHSFDHPMFGSYDAFLYRFLGGIGIDEDAFACDRITVAPVFVEGIDNVKSSMCTMKGKIVSEWYRKDGKIRMHVEIPPQTSAKIVVDGETYAVDAGVYDYTF